ncbi:hypothetical protein AB835_05350 [Candidatus Endobugula sertula]|uniref:Cysteine desulfurase n=1 Tax=Candidatus Endobugula sertula TaxID=62101 RepID=A0A1D2QRJ0_9GAMM|nr:hypothetical protein AB835_05350 [Candidatus Endobugula sertula]
MTFDAQHFKKYFPLFDQPDNQRLIYLDNAATTQKPRCVIEAISHFYLSINGNAQRASHRLARAATEHIEQVRRQAVTFLGAGSSCEVVFTHGATEALNLLAYGLLSGVNPGDEIVLSHAEHHANLLPWQQWASRRQCKLTFFPAQQGVPLWNQWSVVVGERTKVVTLTGASNVLGSLTDLSMIRAIKQRYPHMIVVLDASQMACHIPLQSVDWQCDFLVCSAHKFYGPTGMGLLYGRESLLQALPPLVVGGEMVDTAGLYQSQFVKGVQRFEAGTSSMGAIAGLGGCFDFWQQQDRKAMMAYEQSLNRYLHEQLQQCLQSFQLDNRLKLITKANNNVGIATLISCDETYALADLALWLDEHDIAVRVGDHCAQPLWQALQAKYGQNKGLRFSLAAYNSESDIDQLIVVVSQFFQAVEGSVALVKPDIAMMDNLSNIEWQELLRASSWQRRYTQLLRWGGKIIAKPQIRDERYRIKGCESHVWLQHQMQGQQHYFLMDSDSNVIKGLSALLLLWFNGKTTEEIMAIDVQQRYQQLLLDKHLSASRMNGFRALLDAMQRAVQ